MVVCIYHYKRRCELSAKHGVCVCVCELYLSIASLLIILDWVCVCVCSIIMTLFKNFRAWIALFHWAEHAFCVAWLKCTQCAFLSCSLPCSQASWAPFPEEGLAILFWSFTTCHFLPGDGRSLPFLFVVSLLWRGSQTKALCGCPAGGCCIPFALECDFQAVLLKQFWVWKDEDRVDHCLVPSGTLIGDSDITKFCVLRGTEIRACQLFRRFVWLCVHTFHTPGTHIFAC